MIPWTYDDSEIVHLQVSSSAAASALRALARDWERDETGKVDEDESETDLMVLLSGMVSVSDPSASE